MANKTDDIMDDLPSMGVAETFRAISVCRAAGISSLVWGPPGVGKSSMIGELPRAFTELGYSEDELEPFEVIIGSISDPTEIMGFPSRSETPKSDGSGETSDVIEFLPRSWAQRCLDYGAGVVFLDELTTCPPAVQKTMLQLVFGNKAGDLELPKKTYIVAAANPTNTISGGHNLDPALANRFAHFVMDPSMGQGNEFFLRAMSNPYQDDWSELYRDIPKVPTPQPEAVVQKSIAALASYLKSSQAVISPSGPDNPGSDGFMAYPTRRSWAAVFKMLRYVNPLGSGEELNFASSMISSLVGVAHAQRVMQFMAHLDLPDPFQVLKNPEKFPIDKYSRPDQKFAIMTSLTSITRNEIKTNPGSTQSVDYYLATVKWAEMLDKDPGSSEIAVLFLSDLIRMFNGIKAANLETPDPRIEGVSIEKMLAHAKRNLDLFKSLD